MRTAVAGVGTECRVCLGRRRGACEGFKRERQGPISILQKLCGLQVEAVGLEGLEWRLEPR